MGKIGFIFICCFWIRAGFGGLTWSCTETNVVVHPLQASVTVGFKFVNSSSKLIRIKKITSACGCVSGKVNIKEYKPGESGMVWVRFNLEKRHGAQRKGVVVQTSTERKILYISTIIPKTFVLSKKRLDWKHGEKRIEKSCRIINKGKIPFRLERIVTKQKKVATRLKTIRDGFEYQLFVKPDVKLNPSFFLLKIYPEKQKGVNVLKSFTLYVLVK